MALSHELASQFAKLVKKEDKTNVESTVYGTAVVKERPGGGYDNYVLIDGSDQETPVDSVASITNGQRVSVLIKNHTATVTGNLSVPSASTDDVTSISQSNILLARQVQSNYAYIEQLQNDKANIGDLNAAEARIEVLESSHITTESLAAVKADIENLKTTKLDAAVAETEYLKAANLNAINSDIVTLKAKDVEIDHKLSADAAKIEELEANALTADSVIIKDLQAEVAKIENLDADFLTAESAVIKDLQADVADVNTLMFGSATGNTIHSDFSNAVIAQVGDAQIKSAMIESVSANKITAGDVITNNVRVMSEDGSLVISDETMQISDGTRVRVQIGKDASDDYSINIWDQNGALMFSKGGITESAIKNSIIRNDMVSDTANIAAHKLDIESLFKEINGSTNTIKSTRIYLDDEKQSLDVAFKTMSDSIDDLETSVSSQGTQITVLQGNINSKIWQQDIITAKNELKTETDTLSTQYSELDQKIDGVSATVSSHASQIATKADNSSLTTVSDKVTSLETNLNGFQTTVSSTYATQSDVDGIKSRVQNAETKIDQNTSAINLRATKTELTSALSGYSTTEQMNAAIQLKADNITSTVSSTYATKGALADTQADIDNLTTDTEKAQTTANDAQATATKADTLVQQLADSISMLVTDGNGTSLMTQTEDGWTFSTADIQTSINAASESLNDLITELGDTTSAVNVLQQAVADLGEIAEYVKIGMYEDEPCIELGEGDSDFKLLITNTRIMFMEGSNVPAYINNQSLHIEKAVIEEELQQGEFVWKARSNGNLGLVWKGAIS